MFKNHAGEDIVDQIKFAADQGFTAWEDNKLASRSAAEQERIAKALKQTEMTMGVFVAYANFTRPTFAVKDDTVWAEVLQSIRDAKELKKGRR